VSESIGRTAVETPTVDRPGSTPPVLCVDDESRILQALRRLCNTAAIDVRTASSGAEALACLEREEICVVVSDNMMPGMSGVDLLAEVRRLYPDTVRILMTAYADLETAVRAINQGEVFRFIVKPWQNDRFLEILQEGRTRYEAVKTLRRTDEPMLRSLAQTIELKDPYTRGHCDRVAYFADLIAEALGLSDEMRRHIKHGSWLHDCGKIGVAEAILNKAGPPDAAERAVLNRHPEWGADVAREAELPEEVCNIIRCHHERMDGKGYPAGLAGEEIPLEARIVAIADVYDALTSDRPYRKARTPEKALAIMEKMRGGALDPELYDRFTSLLQSKQGFGR